MEAPNLDNSSKIIFNCSGDSADTNILALLISDFLFPTSNSNMSKSPPLSIIRPIVFVSTNESIIWPESSIVLLFIKNCSS